MTKEDKQYLQDKIYLNIHPDWTDGVDEPEVTWSEEEDPFYDNIPYIRKDALLEWAKELKGQVCALHPNNRDATCARDGMLTIIDNIFDKLNSI